MSRSVVVTALVVVIACSDSPTSVSPPEGARPALIIVSGDRQTGEVGTLLPQPLVVALRDTLGAAVPNVEVRFYDSNVFVQSAVTDADGVASVPWTLGPTASVQRVAAIATVYSGTNGLATATFTMTGLAGSVAQVTVAAPRRVAFPGTQLDTVSARVSDRFDNPIADVQVEWSVESGKGIVRSITERTDERGIARAIWTIGPEVGENTLVVRTAGLVDRISAIGGEGLPAAAVVVGESHTCALATTSETYCWGINSSGQLGLGHEDGVAHPVPTPVSGGLQFTSLAAGGNHTCGLTRPGEAYCWGSNGAGQLGSAHTDRTRPSKIPGGFRFSAITAGDRHTCGIVDGRIVVCWGDNSLGQLGRGGGRTDPVRYGALAHPAPSSVTLLAEVVAITAAANSTCAITSDGAVYCWGGSESGELGDADIGRCRIAATTWYYPYLDEDYDVACSTVPVRISTRPAVALVAVAGRVCSLAADGELACWGGRTTLPPRVIPGARLTTIWMLRDTVCGIDAEDAVSCWALGVPGGFPLVHPLGGRPLVGIAAGSGAHSCGLSRDSTRVVYCWGENHRGQLGNGTVVSASTPVPVLAGLPAISYELSAISKARILGMPHYQRWAFPRALASLLAAPRRSRFAVRRLG